MPDRKDKAKGPQADAAKADGAHEIVSPRDHASGLPTGKRMHKPMAMGADWGPAAPGQAPTASQQAYDGASQTEAGETGNMRMQMQMDRQSKAETAISNTMHAQGETQDEITKNLK